MSAVNNWLIYQEMRATIKRPKTPPELIRCSAPVRAGRLQAID
jgi:hypothetical protein